MDVLPRVTPQSAMARPLCAGATPALMSMKIDTGSLCPPEPSVST